MLSSAVFLTGFPFFLLHFRWDIPSEIHPILRLGFDRSQRFVGWRSPTARAGHF
jgi:hypothetical protein